LISPSSGSPAPDLLLSPGHPHLTDWTFIDAYNSGVGLWLYGEGDLLQVQWDDMLGPAPTAVTKALPWLSRKVTIAACRLALNVQRRSR
jgi:hypothetical protein